VHVFMRTKNNRVVDILSGSFFFFFLEISLVGCELFDKRTRLLPDLFSLCCCPEIFSSFAIVMYLFISHIKTQRAIFKILMYT